MKYTFTTKLVSAGIFASVFFTGCKPPSNHGERVQNPDAKYTSISAYQVNELGVPPGSVHIIIHPNK